MGISKNTYIETVETKEIYSKHKDCDLESDEGNMWCNDHQVELFGYPDYEPDLYESSQENLNG